MMSMATPHVAPLRMAGNVKVELSKHQTEQAVGDSQQIESSELLGKKYDPPTTNKGLINLNPYFWMRG